MATTSKVFIATMAPDPQGHPALQNHRAQSAAPINGTSSVLFGLPFMAAGIFIGWLTANGNPAGKHAPDWLIGILACMFLFAGAFLVVHGLHDLARKAVCRREAALRPSEPWLYDHHWQREGIAFSAFDDMLKRLVAALVWTAFLVPFGWVGTNVRGAWPFLAGTVIFGLLGLIFWFRWAAMLLDLLRYGNSYLNYESFPYPLGGTLQARLRSPHHVSAIDELTLTLRCVQERYVTTGTGQNRSTSVVCYELYKDTLAFDRDKLTGLAGGDIPIEFRLPPDQPTTNLAAMPPIYWEIEAKGKARGADYEAVFLVPVYKVS
jgi:protein-S-isoprenylcysteine O-methyltransferase Ste14